jgi:K+-sensing histidine kinase KdpD
MIVTVERWLEGRSKTGITILAVCILSVIGVVDHFAPSEVAFLLFYLVPIFLITWRLDNPWGVVAAVASAIVWALGEYAGSHTGLWVAGWNLLVEIGLFVSFAGIIGSLHQNLLLQRNLNHELEDALAEVKRLSGLLPICAWCKRIRDDDGNWHPMEDFIRSHTDASITHGICPDCLQKNLGHR